MLINKMYGYKKDVGELSAAYPTSEAFALPYYRDKQLSQPTSLGIIYKVCCQPENRLTTYGYNTPYVDASLRYLLVIEVCEVSDVEDNVRKRPFMLMHRTGITSLQQRNSMYQQCLDPPHPHQTG